MERIFQRCAGVDQVLQSANDLVVAHVALAIIVLVNGDDAWMGSNLTMQILEIAAIVRQDDASIRDGLSQMLTVW